MRSHGRVELIGEFVQVKDHRDDKVSVFVVEEVEYQPKLSLEVADVKEYSLDALPPAAGHARKWLSIAFAKEMI